MRHSMIGIDARMRNHPGIGRYIRELSAALLREKEGDSLIFLDGGAPIYSVWEQIEIPLKAKKVDLLHVPHFNIPLLWGKKLVVTIHDLIYLHEASAARSPFARAYLSIFLKAIERKAAAVIAVSEHTKKDILRALPGLSPEKVFVTYEAASAQFKKIEDAALLDEARRRFSLRVPFILYVGSLRPHKNLPTLIQAVADLKKKHSLPHELIMVGRKDFQDDSLAELIVKNPFVRCLGQLSDSDVVFLYNLAQLFVLPSFWEGFGLPVLEAMACGTPVICSNRASLPEVAGEAALLFEPEQVDALSELIYNVLSDNELRKKMIQKGFEQAGRFSWEKTARQTLHVYQEYLG